MTLLPDPDPDLPNLPTLLTVEFQLIDPTVIGYISPDEFLFNAVAAINDGTALPSYKAKEEQPFPCLSYTMFNTIIVDALTEANLRPSASVLHATSARGNTSLMFSITNTNMDTLDLQTTYQNLRYHTECLITDTQTLYLNFRFETIPNMTAETLTELHARLTPEHTEWVINAHPIRYQQGTPHYEENKTITDTLNMNKMYTQGYGKHKPAQPNHMDNVMISAVSYRQENNPAEPTVKIDPNTELPLNMLYRRVLIENAKEYW